MEDKPLIVVVDAWGNVLKGLTDAGAVTRDCSYHLSESEVDRLIALVDGIVFTGGGDVNPEHYGQEKGPEVYGTSPARDHGELLIARKAIAEGVPVLGICRGHQLVNVAAGGTLHQHIPHIGNGRIQHGATSHLLKVSPASYVGRRLKRMRPFVTSLHHQAVDRVGEGLVAVGWAQDGIVEMIESIGTEPYILGVQFHPEMDLDYPHIKDDGYEAATTIFGHFVERVKDSARSWESVEERLEHLPGQTTFKYGGAYGRGYRPMAWDDDWDGWDSDPGMHSKSRGALILRGEVDEYLGWPVNDVENQNESDGYTAYHEKLDELCAFPPCQYPESCDPAQGSCYREWRALNGDD